MVVVRARRWDVPPRCTQIFGTFCYNVFFSFSFFFFVFLSSLSYVELYVHSRHETKICLYVWCWWCIRRRHDGVDTCGHIYRAFADLCAEVIARCWLEELKSEVLENWQLLEYTAAKKKRIYIFADLSKRTHVFVYNSLRQTIHYETCSASLFFVSYFATLFVFDVVVVVIKCQLSFLVLQLKWQTGTNRVSDRFIRYIIINFPYSIPNNKQLKSSTRTKTHKQQFTRSTM